jgi:hypothetical protein
MFDTGSTDLGPLWTLVLWAVGVAILLLIVAFFVKGLRRDETRGLVKCPACAELIQPQARVCRHCGRDVATEPTRATRR